MSNIKENLELIHQKMNAAAERAGRNPDDVRLVAVSKTKPAEMVLEAIAAGQNCFGENKVQEGREKIPLVEDDAEWHMIGHLQKNKAKYIPGLFTMVHSVDSYALAEALNGAMEKAIGAGKELKSPVLDVLVQVNIAGEAQKGGVSESETVQLVRDVAKLPHLKVKGLMIIPPYSDDAEETRSYFKRLRELKEAIAAENIGNVEMTELSMGMSGDFEVAVEEGATLVRVGSSIFGARKYT